MAYTRINWQDGPSGGTPLSAANLNHMDQGIADAHADLDALVRSLQAGTAFSYYLTPPNVELSSSNTDYDDWWIQDVTRSVVVRILLPGTIRYHVQYRSESSVVTIYVRILLNGSQIRQVSTSSTSWQTVTDNITVSPGDIVTIQKRSSVTADAAYWRNVRIETAQPPLGIQPF